MKARIDCQKCRKAIYKEAETEYLKHEYKFFEDSAYSLACYAMVVALGVHVRRGRSRTYIRSFFDECCLLFDLPDIFGKTIKMADMMKLLENEYGIDFRKIKLRLETEKEFIKQTQKEAKNK